MHHTSEAIKQALGQKAASLVQDGMKIGLGSGTTAAYFIQSLATKVQEGLLIQAAASSVASEQLARKYHIPLLQTDEITQLDLNVDGADQIDSYKRLIKGRGGALLREKIIASASKKNVILIEHTKLRTCFEDTVVPVEVIPFAYPATLKALADKGFVGTLRKTDSHQLYLTDQGNYLFDILIESCPVCPELTHELLISIPGVVETGLFFSLPFTIWVGYEDHIEELPWN